MNLYCESEKEFRHKLRFSCSDGADEVCTNIRDYHNLDSYPNLSLLVSICLIRWGHAK